MAGSLPSATSESLFAAASLLLPESRPGTEIPRTIRQAPVLLALRTATGRSPTVAQARGAAEAPETLLPGRREGRLGAVMTSLVWMTCNRPVTCQGGESWGLGRCLGLRDRCSGRLCYLQTRGDRFNTAIV